MYLEGFQSILISYGLSVYDMSCYHVYQLDTYILLYACNLISIRLFSTDHFSAIDILPLYRISEYDDKLRLRSD